MTLKINFCLFKGAKLQFQDSWRPKFFVGLEANWRFSFRKSLKDCLFRKQKQRFILEFKANGHIEIDGKLFQLLLNSFTMIFLSIEKYFSWKIIDCDYRLFKNFKCNQRPAYRFYSQNNQKVWSSLAISIFEYATSHSVNFQLLTIAYYCIAPTLRALKHIYVNVWKKIAVQISIDFIRIWGIRKRSEEMLSIERNSCPGNSNFNLNDS